MHYFYINFYPHPPRGGRPVGVDLLGEGGTISTHTLREEGDRGRNAEGVEGEVISTHTLREEGDGAASISLPVT